MRLLSNDWLSVLNTLLQWLAVVGTGLGLLSGVGLILTRRELSERQTARLTEARQEAANARQLAHSLESEISAVKRYAYVATLTFNGMIYTKGDVIMPTAISPSVEGTWVEVAENKFRPVCEPAALDKCRAAIEKFPDFPFTYYALAYCLEKRNDPAWHGYAEKSLAIFERTTAISGHQESHDQMLAYLRALLEK